MRFRWLEIPAFGPFTNLRLEFQDTPGDLHVIYGGNEAGKSSLLRAIRDLLFGIPTQSPDDFLHEYKELRIKAEISGRGGERIGFQRRKGSRNTLQDLSGNALPDQALSALMGSVDEAYFCAMFGLGARELHEGAEHLLRGEGELGQALFSASFGGTPVQRVVESLREQAAQLYAGRATTKVTIRPAAAAYKDLMRESREAMVKPEDWVRLEQALAEAEAQKRAIDVQIANVNCELARIARCEGALPMAGRLSEVLLNLAQLPPLPELPADFATRARAGRAAAAAAETAVRELRARMANVQSQLDGLKEAPAVLSCASTLEHLHQTLGAYRSAKGGFDEQSLRLAGLEQLVRAGMTRLGCGGEIESVASCAVSTPARLALEAAAEELRNAAMAHSANARKVQELQEEIREQETALQAIPERNVDKLRDALTAAEPAIEANSCLAATQAEVIRLRRETAALHAQVVGAPSHYEAAAALEAPLPATIRMYKDQLDGLARDAAALEAKLRAEEAALTQVNRELAQISRGGLLPSEEDLRQARAHRDRCWALVLAEWKGQGAPDELEPGAPLADAFPKAMQRADELADALRRDADAVAQAEQKRVQIAQLGEQIEQTRAELSALGTTRAERQRAWEREWLKAGVVARSPAEMLEWHDQWTAFRQRLEKLRAAEDTLASQSERVAHAAGRLAEALAQPGESSFSVLFAKAKAAVQEGEHLRGRREAAARQLERERRQLIRWGQKLVEQAAVMTDASDRWRKQCQASGLPADASPDIGLSLLRERQELHAGFLQWQEARSRRRAATQLIEEYEQLAAKTADALHMGAESTAGLVDLMWAELTRAREVQVSRAALSAQLGQLQSELQLAETRLTETSGALEALARSSGLAVLDEPVLAQLEQREAFRAQVAQLRADLAGLAAGTPLDEFIELVRRENADALAAKKATAQNALTEHQAVLARTQETVFKLQEEKRALEMRGDKAAHLRQRAESQGTTLRHDAARFIRLRLAAHFLELQVEQFRKENQGPLLQKTGAIFSAITRGSYSGLAADISGDDTPVLAATRSDGTRVFVEGLSDGTRDQLYLALRLAALDRRLETHEPMPLILDDLLITFDDERAAAILPQLAELARRTQIFLFTHHRHLVDLCRKTLPDGQFQIHALRAGLRPSICDSDGP